MTGVVSEVQVISSTTWPVAGAPLPLSPWDKTGPLTPTTIPEKIFGDGFPRVTGTNPIGFAPTPFYVPPGLYGAEYGQGPDNRTPLNSPDTLLPVVPPFTRAASPVGSQPSVTPPIPPQPWERPGAWVTGVSGVKASEQSQREAADQKVEQKIRRVFPIFLSPLIIQVYRLWNEVQEVHNDLLGLGPRDHTRPGWTAEADAFKPSSREGFTARQPETLYEGYTLQQEQAVKGFLDILGIKTDGRIKRMLARNGNLKDHPDMMAYWSPGDKTLGMIPERLSRMAPEHRGHGMQRFLMHELVHAYDPNLNPRILNSLENRMITEHIGALTNQMLQRKMYLNPYHKYLCNQYKNGDITLSHLHAEVRAIVAELRAINPAKLDQIDNSRARKGGNLESSAHSLGGRILMDMLELERGMEHILDQRLANAKKYAHEVGHHGNLLHPIKPLPPAQAVESTLVSSATIAPIKAMAA